ncbi:MAG: hypothetical protein KDE24_32060, partial [Caldilinea sp.]|nr:hypothetical protein [Caldilinea sp.]
MQKVAGRSRQPPNRLPAGFAYQTPIDDRSRNMPANRTGMKLHAQMGDISPGGLGMPSPYIMAESISQRSSLGGFGAATAQHRPAQERIQ